MIVSAILSVCFVIQGAFATPALDDWSRVLSLPRGATIRVASAGGEPKTGQIVDVTQTTLTIKDFEGEHALRRDAVSRVESRRSSHTVKRGFLVGAAFGLGLAAVTVKSNQQIWFPFLSLGWGTIGAGGGLLASPLTQRFDLVYERKASLAVALQ
jgi:hypothetical protein